MSAATAPPPARPAVGAEPRWPATVAVLAVALLYLALPEALTVGPSWLLLAVVATLLVPTILARRAGDHALNQFLGYLVLAAVTLALALSLARLVVALPSHAQRPAAILRSAAALWATNVLVFASWYWRLDAGGPNARDGRRARGAAHGGGAFLFPQTMLDPASRAAREAEGWHPEFIDYLFLAFTTSTAFSPTDTAVVSRWAKALMMVQASLSFATLAVLVSHAISIL